MHRQLKEPVCGTGIKTDSQAARAFAHLHFNRLAHAKGDDAALVQLIAYKGDRRTGIVDEQLHAGIGQHPYMPGICIAVAFHGADQLDIRLKRGKDGMEVEEHGGKI